MNDAYNPLVTYVFYVLDADAEPPLYTFKMHNQDSDRGRALFYRSGETGVFHFADTVTDDNFERCEPSDTLRLAVAQAAEGTVPSERVDELAAWEADFLRCTVNTINDDPEAVPWGVHRWVDDCCAEYRGAVESSSLAAEWDSDDDDAE